MLNVSLPYENLYMLYIKLTFVKWFIIKMPIKFLLTVVKRELDALNPL